MEVKTVEQHIDELVEFYRETEFKDPAYLKKLVVRNLQDVKRRYLKEKNQRAKE